jgi:hypothetical protein
MNHPHERVSVPCTAAGLGLVVAAAATLVSVGTRSLSVPLGSWRELLAWLDHTPPGVTAVALLRLLALGLCGYLAAALSITVLVGLADRQRRARQGSRSLPPGLRQLVAHGARSGVVGSVILGWLGPVVGATPALAATTDDDPTSHTATMAHLDPASEEPPAGSATMTDLGAAPQSPAEPVPTSTPGTGVARETATPSAPGPGTPAAPPSSAPSDPPPTTHDEWVVAPGESFWSIAEEVLTDARGTRPAEHEVAHYWQQLVAANHERLAAPGNADLLLTGQHLHIPPPG